MVCAPWLYTRLSVDDGYVDRESNSITSQKQMLTQFAEYHGIEIVETYVDDGWSGTNFERPDFKRMIADIESGKIGAADFLGYVTGVKIIEQIFERRHLVISCACVDTVADRYVAYPLAGDSADCHQDVRTVRIGQGAGSNRQLFKGGKDTDSGILAAISLYPVLVSIPSLIAM